MTVAHPSVVTLRPPAKERALSRLPKSVIASERETRVGFLRPRPRPATASPVGDRIARERVKSYVRTGIIAFSGIVRLAIAAALIVAGYMLITQGIVPLATEVFTGWYTGAVAPHMGVDFTFGTVGPSPAVQMGILPGLPDAISAAR
ncbi:hypothetical protein [Demequina sp. NBRC 110056]|uniref:hypothetical protein n=1 Tax=Demequina sp. NBRC 110056 TaxID=1570345 RepID=UPI00117CE1E0|nr:hypothetical protein [Demequina sp. NBRC 110056]